MEKDLSLRTAHQAKLTHLPLIAGRQLLLLFLSLLSLLQQLSCGELLLEMTLFMPVLFRQLNPAKSQVGCHAICNRL